MNRKIQIFGILQHLSLLNLRNKLNGVELNEVLEIQILILLDLEQELKLTLVELTWVEAFLLAGVAVAEHTGRLTAALL